MSLALRAGLRGSLALAAVGLGVLAWRSGGGADVAAPPPRPHALDASTPSPGAARPVGTWEVSTRLLEHVTRVRTQGDPASAARILGLHPWKMKPAFVPLTGDAARWVSSIALRTSTSETPATPGKPSAPDARTWNMNEGSFDQREALVAPTETTFSFRIEVPAGGKLTFAEGTVNATPDTTVFVVTVVDAKGDAHELLRDRLPPARARRWTERSVDLAAFAGQSVELRLATETAPPTPDEAEGPPPSPPAPPVALWANPTILARTQPQVPYNVLWIVVDALRPDVLASFHDDAEDAALARAELPPLEAALPKIPGLMPVLDALAAKGTRFTHAYSGGAWTRPGTLAMLSGLRSSELGIDTTSWVLQKADVARFYASEPPLLPLLARRQGMVSAAFVNNDFMVGYARVGVEMGFERAAVHRFRTRDTLEITNDATRFLRAHGDLRFFAFVNYRSPHEPYEPPKELEKRVPPTPAGPADAVTRRYMAEAAKDDQAIGVLLAALDEAGLRERTIIVVTADHGETLSSAHAGTSALDEMPVRYHHAVSNYEETTRIPILVVAPGALPEGKAVTERVRSVDLAPTILELLGLEPNPRMTGKSLVPLARGQEEEGERVVVSEGRGTRAILYGRHRLLTREGLARTTRVGGKVVVASEELYDLVSDPGERRDLAKAEPELVAEMRARLAAALANAPVAGAPSPSAVQGAALAPPVVHLRFASGGRTRRVSGSIVVGDARTPATSVLVTPVDLGRDAWKAYDRGSRVDVAFTTNPSAIVGFDLVVDPPAAPVAWDLYLDEEPWPAAQVFGGPYGLVAPGLRRGLVTDEARRLAGAPAVPPLDPRRDGGLFVVRARRGEPREAEGAADEGVDEMTRLREWGLRARLGGERGP